MENNNENEHDLKSKVRKLETSDIQKILTNAFKTTSIESFTFAPFQSIGIANPIYEITCKLDNSDEKKLILKVSCPIFVNKTLNEVTTMNFLHNDCKYDWIPKIYDYKTDRNNGVIEYEYILMERVPGECCDMEFWKKLDKEGRKKILKQCAKIFVEMKKHSVIKSVDYYSKNDNVFDSLKVFGGFMRKIELVSDNEINVTFNGDVKNTDGGCKKTFNDVLNGEIDMRLPYFKKCGFEKYIKVFEKVRKFIADYKFDEMVFCLTHTDFQPKNLVIDKKTLKINALVDWEWASILNLGNDFSDFFHDNSWEIDEEENKYFCDIVNSFDVPHIKLPPKGYIRTTKISKLSTYSMILTCYKSWFVDKDKEAEEYIKKEEMNMIKLFKEFKFL